MSREYEVCELEDAQHMAQRMVDIVLPDNPFVEGDEVVVTVYYVCGATTCYGNCMCFITKLKNYL